MKRLMITLMTVILFLITTISTAETAGTPSAEASKVKPEVNKNTKEEIAPPQKVSAKTASKLVSSRMLTAIPSRPLAPSFNLPDDEGEMHALSDYKGKVVIINFWATWCPPCRAELPSMNKAWEKLKDHDVQMLAVNVGEDEDTVFAFTGEQEINFQILLDESGEIINLWPVRGLPTTFVLDKEGRVVYRAVGGRDWNSDEIINIIKKL